MKGLRHNLLPSPHRKRAFGISVLVLCGLWSSYILQQYQQNVDQMAGVKFRRDHLLSRQSLTLQRTRIDSVPGSKPVTDELGYEWGPVVHALETPSGNAVRLLAADPDPKTSLMTLTGEADSLKDALDYLQALQKQAGLRNVHLDQHQINNETGAIHFVASALWSRP